MNIAARIALTATLILGMALIAAGTLGTFPRAEWVVFAGLGLFVLAGLPALNALIFRPVVERKRMSNSLAVLSSAAILAVYAAGYERTSDAAQGFAQQAAAPRRRAAPPTAPVADRAERPQVPVPVLESAAAAPAGRAEIASAAIPRESESAVPDSATVGQAESGTAVTAVIAAIEDQFFISVNNTPAPALPPSPAPAASPVAAAPPQVWEYYDGAYYGKGISRHGDLYVQVIIAAGRIVSADIYKCETQYPCSVIKTVPPQIVSRQDPDRIDNVSGATDSVDAYYWAVAAALDQAVK